MDKIILKDLEVMARHGVNPEEKVTPQRFLISVEAYADISRAAREDKLSDTISYSAVKKTAKKHVEENCFDLIETLAASLARLILAEFPIARGVKVTAKKPDAPMSGKFDYAAVETELVWRRIYLSLGSSEGDRDKYLDFAIKSLNGDPAFRDVRESGRVRTEPYGGVAKGEFLNSAVEAYTYLTPRELLATINGIEEAAGRIRETRWADRTLDMDIIFFGDDIIDDEDLCVPHCDMANREFVLAPLCELNAYKLHPILQKRAFELLDDLRARERDKIVAGEDRTK